MSRGRVVAAVILIGLGVLFLLSNFGTLHIGQVLHTYWPSIFIFIGLSGIISTKDSRNASPYIFLLVGIVLQADKLDWIQWEWHLYWPIIIILFGLWILLRPRSQKWWPGNTISSEMFDVSAFLSGTQRIVQSTNLKGGEATAILGGIKLDLRQAKTNEKHINVNVTTIMGGIELLVPPSWQLQNQITPILGGTEDSRKNVLVDPGGNAPTLILKGTALFGGVEIKD